ncbi:hypothetical protein LAZ67_13002440 [Cordylochernes scorpioides]|uniref:Histone-lysine N-methyltransferase SETMAR n=1 Tax=Cordylochernes scorpioides TaxID=51811 RepID=A0ABY6L4L4_9ARAC|nr:hypothetical protein LAZ67_13002440 [Cordylochernes scorpioides]
MRQIVLLESKMLIDENLLEKQGEEGFKRSEEKEVTIFKEREIGIPSHVSPLPYVQLNGSHHLGYETLDHPPYSPDLSTTDYHFIKHLANFLDEKCFKNQGDAETAFYEFIASRTPDFL